MSLTNESSLAAHWSEFCKCSLALVLEGNKLADNYSDPHYFSQVSDFARTWATEHIREVREGFQASPVQYRQSVLRDLSELEDRIPDMRYPFEDKD